MSRVRARRAGARRPGPGGMRISEVAQRYDVHPQTLRLYERSGLLRPARSRGNTRYYTGADLERLALILSLSRDLGVNLAGIEVVLNMRERLERLQAEVDSLMAVVRELGGPEARNPLALVRVGRPMLVRAAGARRA